MQYHVRIALILLGLGVGAVLAELILRVLPVAPAGDLRGLHELRADRPWLYGLRPGAQGRLQVSGDVLYTVNADGFRDRRYRRPKPPGTYRIIVIGDSVTFGYGVEEAATFPKVLEARLASRSPGRSIEVMNLGVGGYNPYTEAALLSDVGTTYEPDVVLVQFCINDLNDPTLHFDAQTRQHLGTLPDAAFPNPAQRHQPASSFEVAAVTLCHWSRLCTLADEALLAWHPLPLDAAGLQRTFAPYSGDETGPEWSWLAARYGEMARVAATHHARFAVVIFPFDGQLTPAATRAVQGRIVTLGQESGWETIDLLPAFRKAATDAAPLFLDVWHPTSRGHGIAAGAILDDLSCRGWLPGIEASSCPEN